MRKWRSLLFARLFIITRCLFLLHGNFCYKDDHHHDHAEVMIVEPDEGAAINLMYHLGNYS